MLFGEDLGLGRLPKPVSCQVAAVEIGRCVSGLGLDTMFVRFGARGEYSGKIAFGLFHELPPAIVAQILDGIKRQLATMPREYQYKVSAMRRTKGLE